MNLFIIAGMIGAPEAILIVVVVLIVFGGRKIPELMKGLGQGIKEFKKSSSSDDTDKKDNEKIEK